MSQRDYLKQWNCYLAWHRHILRCPSLTVLKDILNTSIIVNALGYLRHRRTGVIPARHFRGSLLAPPEIFWEVGMTGENPNIRALCVMNEICVYVLRSKSTGQHYVGISKFGPKRFRQHEKGQSVGTRGKGPWELIYQEKHPDYNYAREREVSQIR
jgi:predicted GIY-YIG superfamily endonuclease